MKQKLSKVTSALKKVPEKKHYAEFITAVLSIPVLLSVILLNYSNLSAQSNKENKESPSPSVTIREVIIRENSPKTVAQTKDDPTPTPQEEDKEVCKKEIGPLSISYPHEGQTVSDNPLSIVIRYEDDSYCSVVWSYRINNGTWSEYSSTSPTIYNMPPGNVKFELRVQSTVSSDTTQLERNFIYQGASSTPAQTPAPTSS